MKSTKPFSALAAFIFLVFAGCDTGGSSSSDNNDNGDDGDLSPPATTQTFSAVADGNGSASISFGLPEGANKFQVIANTDSDISFLDLNSSAGVNYLNPGGISLGFATEPGPTVNAASVPARSADPSIVPGLSFQATTSSGTGGAVNYRVLSKADPDLMSGQLVVNVFYVDVFAQNDTSRNNVKQALDIFRSIYSDEAHINVLFNDIDISGPALLPVPVEGSSFYTNASALGQSPGVNLFIGADIASVQGANGAVLGISGSIGGPSLPSPVSAVAASLITATGGDGEFTGDDIEVFGETMAHEVGHFLGLFHPVEISDQVVVGVDPLDDTPSCFTYNDCVDNDDLVSNLMFPFAVPDNDGGYLHQNQLTTDQRAVQNLYIAVD